MPESHIRDKAVSLILPGVPIRAVLATPDVGYADWATALAEDAHDLSNDINDPFLHAKAEILARCAKSLRLIDEWDEKGCGRPPEPMKADVLAADAV